MQINIDDCTFIGETMAQEAAQEHLKKEKNACTKFPIEKYIELKNKFSKDNILNTEYAFGIVERFVEGCIMSYHEQLRKVLLAQSIDIGEFDITTGSYRHDLMGQTCKIDEEQ